MSLLSHKYIFTTQYQRSKPEKIQRILYCHENSTIQQIFHSDDEGGGSLCNGISFPPAYFPPLSLRQPAEQNVHFLFLNVWRLKVNYVNRNIFREKILILTTKDNDLRLFTT